MPKVLIPDTSLYSESGPVEVQVIAQKWSLSLVLS